MISISLKAMMNTNPERRRGYLDRNKELQLRAERTLGQIFRIGN
jgi:hypothetical protein